VSTDGKLRILLADDHPLVREALKALLNREEDLLVVGDAGDGPQALALVRSISPYIALCDVSMPGWDGVTLANRLLEARPDVRVIAFTRHTDHAFVKKMMDAGAWGYVLKQSPPAELLRAIRAVASGERYIDATIRMGSDTGAMLPAPTYDLNRRLTSQEERVLRLVASAYSNQEIAGRLCLEASVVAALKSTAMNKAGLTSRLQVIAYAESRGWA
jgi:DNA-binding NarL/FixJ family response regulator